MATKSKPTTTAIAKWDEELAREAEIAANMEANTAGGQFFSTKSGVLSWNDAQLPDNQMAVIILDSIMENDFYEGEYDPKNPVPPLCFAFGRDEKAMAPHKIVIEAGNAQHEGCQGCEWNEFGTADKGRGKACKNTRRLAMIPAGTLTADGRFTPFDDVAKFESAAPGFMRLPVTSVRGYASFVKQVAGALKRPPYGVFTKVKVVPDAKNQYQVTFEALGKVGDELMPTVHQRHQELMATIDFPYALAEEQPAPPPPRATRGRAATAPARGGKNVAPARKAGRKY